MKVAIFNSFPFHFETFGYIFHFVKQNNYQLTIYTNQNDPLGWLKFYENLFNFEYSLTFAPKEYDLIFVTTDDDYQFRHEWISDKVICINHYYKIRKFYKNYINIANFFESDLDFSLACFPQISASQKVQNNIVTVIGGHNGPERTKILQRIVGENVIIYILGRKMSHDVPMKNVIIKEDIDTTEMFEILNKSSYLLINDNNLEEFKCGKKASGSLPLAFTCLCKPIILDQTNKIHQLDGIEYSLSDDPIILNGVNFKLLEKQRDFYINKFDKLVKQKIIKNTALIVEPRFLDDLPKIIHNIYDNVKWDIVFYCGKGLKEQWSELIKVPIEIRELEINNFTAQEYNTFLKQRNLYESLYGEYILVFQADTWIINTVPIESFLNKSYIGGNMSYKWYELENEKIIPDYRNFNGGLSLRKRSDMIKIIDEYPDTHGYAEDVYFTVGCYKLNLPIGDDQFSQQFANHTILTEKCFGIHYSGYMNKQQLILRYPELKSHKYL